MLRLVLVVCVLVVGLPLAAASPTYALVLYVWNAYFRPETWVWSDGLAQLRLSYFLAMLLIARTLLSREKLPFDWRCGLLLLLVAFTGVSSASSPFVQRTLPFWIEFAKSLMITYFIVVLTTDVKRMRLLLVAMVVSLGFEGAKQGWAQLLLNPGAVNANKIPFLGDNNGVAVGMVMLLPLAGLLAQTAHRRWEKRLFLVLLVGVAYRAISTHSRGGFLAMGGVAAMELVRSPHRLKVLVVIVLCAALIVPALGDTFWDRMSTIVASEDEERDASASGRLHFWRVAVAIANAHPVGGVGLWGYHEAYDAHDDANGAFGFKRAVHSSWFGVLAETGYPGFALYVVILGTALMTCRRIARDAQATGALAPLQPYARALEVSLIGFSIGGSFVALQYNEMYWHLIGVTIALGRMADRMRSEAHAMADPAVPTSAPGDDPVSGSSAA